jgi:hypothetical protein
MDNPFPKFSIVTVHSFFTSTIVDQEAEMSKTSRRVISGAAAVIASLAATVAASSPAFADSHTITHPTAGVACDDWVRTPSTGGYSYWGRCYGTPIGTSRGYMYREEYKCHYIDKDTWVFGPWKVDGSWSHTYNCPADSQALAHHVNFTFV